MPSGAIDPWIGKGYNGNMNRIPCLLAVIAVLCSYEVRAEDGPALPEMPAVSRDTPTIDTGGPAALPALNQPNSLPATRQMPTAEQLDQLKKEKNWLVEGMKERQNSEAQAARQPEDMSQSIIDMVLQRQKPGSPAAPRNTQVQMPDASRTPAVAPGSSSVLRPSISTSAFDPLPNRQDPNADGGMQSILARERALADQNTSTSPLAAAPARDPLANPFANLPVPEGALPSAPRNRGVYNVNDPMLQSAWSNPAPELNANPALTAKGTGLAVNESGAPPAVRSTIEQPYDYLRAQEQQRQRLQQNSNRPTVRQLRSPGPEPNDARLF